MNNNEDQFIIGNAIIADGAGIFIENGAIHVQGTDIKRIGRTKDLKSKDIKFIDVGGRIVMPGLLNAHHHLYSAFAPGLICQKKLNGFSDILENIWWKLDKAMDKESIYFSALYSLIDSVKHGVTMIFDHHASMNCVEGSTFEIARAFEKIGIKGAIGFEVSDRDGISKTGKHIQENLNLYDEYFDSPNILGTMAMHANFTLSDDTLKLISKKKPHEMPIHIHCGEDIADLEYCREKGYEGPLERLNRFGLLNNKSILAHCIYLGQKDYELAHDIDPIIVSNPESNANNCVGRMDRKKIWKYILGTDGLTTNMINTLRTDFLSENHSLERSRRIFFGYRYCAQKQFFPKTGEFQAGNNADIAVLDYIPITPISSENLISHMVYGIRKSHVYMTFSSGQLIFKEGKMLSFEESSFRDEASRVAKKLHRRFYG